MMPVHQFPESDCKTSPLALLVQICSNIGAEKPTPKSSSDKNNSSSANGNNSSSSSSNSSSDEIRVTKDKDTPCSPANSVHSASSLTSSSARTPREEPPASTKRSTPSECRSSPQQRRPTPDLPQRPKSKTPVSSSSSSHEATPTSTSEPTYSSSSSLDFNGSSLGKAVNGLNPLALANCSGCSPVAGHIPLEAAYPKGAYSFGSAAALSPYMNYGRHHKGGSFVPVCRDPYCSNCQLAAQLPYGPDRLAMSGLYPGLPGYPVVPGFASPGSFASPPRGAIVCNWMLGDTFCGKRFSTSEELLQHLRTHASLLGSGSLPLYSPASLPLTMDGLYSAPSLTTPAGLRRTYPTSLSPVSSLSAAGRYHPYKPPGLSPLSSAPLPPLGHPGLSFYNPYSGVYGKG